MLRRLGYACLCTSLPDSSPKGTILRNASPERLRALIEGNLERLGRVLRYNVEHGIRLFRISSDVIPFGSHPVNEIAWWDEQRDRLDALGAYIREHDLRVSTHPGQFTVLSTADPKILAAAVRDLAYQARLLDALGTDTRHKIVIHVGGAYGDKPSAIGRWVAAVRGLPRNVHDRLVLENDERLFGVDDVRDERVVKGLWASVERGDIHLWLLVDPIDADSERRLYEIAGQYFDETPDADFQLHILNPRLYAGDAREALPADAAEIPLRVA